MYPNFVFSVLFLIIILKINYFINNLFLIIILKISSTDYFKNLFCVPITFFLILHLSTILKLIIYFLLILIKFLSKLKSTKSTGATPSCFQ